MDSRDFLREARIMKELRHPNLIQLYAVGIISKYEFLIIEALIPKIREKLKISPFLQGPGIRVRSFDQNPKVLHSIMCRAKIKYSKQKPQMIKGTPFQLVQGQRAAHQIAYLILAQRILEGDTFIRILIQTSRSTL